MKFTHWKTSTREITAGQGVPRDSMPGPDHNVVARVGSRGENAVSVLYRGRDEVVAQELRFSREARQP